MIFFLNYICDTSGSLVNAIESHGLHIATLFIMPIVIDLRKNTVVGFEELDARFPFGVVRHGKSVNHLIILVDDLQAGVMYSEYSAFVVNFAIAVAVGSRNAEEIFFS